MLNDILVKTGKVAVWGIGYLGYTTLLRLQRAGIATRVWAYEAHNMEELRAGTYPGKELQFAWSEMGIVPPLMLDAIEFAKTPEELFSPDVALHLIALPNRINQPGQVEKVWDGIAGFFKRAASRDGRRLTVLLTAASVPGDVDRFVSLVDSPNVCVVSVFRSDWVLEEYLYKSQRQAVGGTEDGVAVAREFLKELGITSFAVGSHADAEVYQACASSLNYVISAYVNQFGLAYPKSDLRRIAEAAIANSRFSWVRPVIGLGGRQMLNSVEFSLMGSKYDHQLSILKEAQAFSLSLIMCYADFLVRCGAKRVAILGITPQPDNTDLTLSPSVLLAEALTVRGISVSVHDPLLSRSAVSKVLPGTGWLELGSLQSPAADLDALVLMTPHRHYLGLTQREIGAWINGRVRLVIDNTGAWKNFSFSGGTQYHLVGDGTLDINV